jgi:hypothetical protein
MRMPEVRQFQRYRIFAELKNSKIHSASFDFPDLPKINFPLSTDRQVPLLACRNPEVYRDEGRERCRGGFHGIYIHIKYSFINRPRNGSGDTENFEFQLQEFILAPWI